MSTQRVSETWLRDQARRESRVEHHTPRLQWPVRKVVNESAWLQTPRLRREAAARRSA